MSDCQGNSLTNVNHCVLFDFWFEGHRGPLHEAESLSPSERIVAFEPATF